MNAQKRELTVVASILAITLAGGAYFGYRHRAVSLQRAQAHIQTFLEGPRTMASLMIDRYGPPNALAPDVVTWYERGSWKRVTVHGDAPLSYLEQAVGYHVPLEAVTPLREFGHGLRFDPVNEEMSATSNSESLNILALNLANELCSAKRTPKEASDLYVRTARLAAAGKSSSYTEKLLFEPYRLIPVEPWNREIGY
ncbi:MAG: hypothetical protein PHS14_08360 [Elusimicrobia bacterium]|nr:hypothetical protein [Elusimicrobiota bacterium]